MTSETATILVVDDEKGLRDLTSDILSVDGHTVETAENAQVALEKLENAPFDLVLTDVRMPGMDGLELLTVIHDRWPATPVIILTAFGTIPQAVDAIQQGAFDFIEKPVKSPKALRGIVHRALGSRSREATAPPVSRDHPTYVCEDPRSFELRDLLDRVAPRDTTVLLTGESGAGKEVAAQYLHASSPRASGPFVAVNAAAIPANLLEDELFGHEKGAFTGAELPRAGLFETADGGTLFLDEIGEMSADLQARLLRVLETQSFTRLGSTAITEVDVRLIAATNRDLQAEVRSNRFRQDLYYRLSVFPVHIPPLRERPGDIIPLANVFLEELASPSCPTLCSADESKLLAHDWPGNVRELRNTMERGLVLGETGTFELPALTSPGASSTDTSTATLKELEKQAVLRALQQADGNRKKASEILGISLRNLQYKIKQYGLKKR